MTDTYDQILDLIGPGNGPGCQREPRDTELLKAAMPLAVEAVARARVALDRGATAIDMQPADIVAAGFLILSRDAIEMVAVQSTPIDTTGARAPCGWCKRAAADIEAVLVLPRYTEPEHVAHVIVCEHNPLVSEVARLTRALHDAEAHPDFEYETTRTARKSGETRRPDGDGWEPNLRVDNSEYREGVLVKEYRRNWERYEFHEEEFWMRRKEGK